MALRDPARPYSIWLRRLWPSLGPATFAAALALTGAAALAVPETAPVRHASARGTSIVGRGRARAAAASVGAASSSSAAPVGATTGQADIGAYYEQVDTWYLPTVVTDVLPVDVALGRDGVKYVADGSNRVVVVIDAEGHVTMAVPAVLPPRSRLVSDDGWPMAVDIDLERERLYVLWMWPGDGASTVSEHQLDGTAVGVHATGHFARSGDLAVHGPSGDVYVYVDGLVRRFDAVDWSGTTVLVGQLRPIPARIAVLDSGSVAVCAPQTRALRVLEQDGTTAWEHEFGEGVPVAVDVDASGLLHVLLTAADPSGSDAPLVVVFDAHGNLVGERIVADVGAPQTSIAHADAWPYGLDCAGDSAVFSTMDEGGALFVYELPRDDPAELVLTGGSPDGPYVPTAGGDDPSSGPVSDALALATGPDRSLVALDGAESRLLRFDDAGEATVIAGTPGLAVDVAIGPDGAAYVSTDDDKLVRIETTGAVTPTWELPCYCSYGGRLAVAGTALYVSQPLQQQIAAIDLGSRVVLAHVALPDAVGLWPSDVASGATGRLFTGDVILSQVQSWRAPSAPDIIWQAGLLAGPRRLSAARLDDGSEVVGTYMADGYVELHAALDGNLLSRWKPVLADGTAPTVSDIAVAADGRVFIADKAARAVRVFAPAVGPTPTPEGEAPPTPTPSDRSCRVEGDKVAGPPRIVLGETAQVTLTLAAECPDTVRIIGADIMLVMDVSGSMAGDKLEAAEAAALNFVTLLDVRYHRVGLVSFSNESTLVRSLTADIGALVAAFSTLNAVGSTNITAGLNTAYQHLMSEGRAEALPVIVLLSDGEHNVGAGPAGVATNARNAGVQIYAIGLGTAASEVTLVEVTGNADRYFYAPTPDELFPIYEEILREVLSSLAGNLIIDDEMGDDIEYVTGSASPSGLEQPDRLRWGRSLLPSSGVTMTYDILPLKPGLLPTNRRAVADYNDGDGVRRQYVFPEPVIEVITPTPTPTNTPTATPTPTITPSPTRVPLPAFLPIVYKDHCLPGTAHADIVLLIDTSSSMEGTKLVDAKAAAATFVGLLNLRYDQAAVVGFDNGPRLASPLSNDRDRLLRAIASLDTRQGTMIDRALWAALEVLDRSPQRKVDNVPVVVMLSDGAHNGSAGAVLVAAEAVRGAGAPLFVIGLGGDADVSLLESVADPGRYFFAPDSGALEGIYRSIAVRIPCR